MHKVFIFYINIFPNFCENVEIDLALRNENVKKNYAFCREEVNVFMDEDDCNLQPRTYI